MKSKNLWMGMNADGIITLFSGQPVFDGREWKPVNEDTVYETPLEQDLALYGLEPGQCLTLVPSGGANDIKGDELLAMHDVVRVARDVMDLRHPYDDDLRLMDMLPDDVAQRLCAAFAALDKAKA